jgi:hypothetical protein
MIYVLIYDYKCIHSVYVNLLNKSTSRTDQLDSIDLEAEKLSLIFLINDSNYRVIVEAHIAWQMSFQKVLIHWVAAEGSVGPVSLLSLNLRVREEMVDCNPNG